MRSLLSAMVKPYLVKNPTAVAALDLIRKHDGGPVCYDHFAFRTFGVSPIMLSVVIVLMGHGNGAIHGNEWCLLDVILCGPITFDLFLVDWSKLGLP